MSKVIDLQVPGKRFNSAVIAVRTISVCLLDTKAQAIKRETRPISSQFTTNHRPRYPYRFRYFSMRFFGLQQPLCCFFKNFRGDDDSISHFAFQPFCCICNLNSQSPSTISLRSGLISSKIHLQCEDPIKSLKKSVKWSI